MFTRPICRTFAWLATKTWRDLQDAFTGEYPMKEESVTDYLLLELKRCHPDEVLVRPFNRYEEGKTFGADWEWWLESNGRFFGMRIQAKILNTNTLRYNHLFTTTVRRCSQVNKLIRSAKQASVPALYCFYNYWPRERYLPVWNCKTFAPSFDQLGCSIADASVIRAIIKKQTTKNLIDIQPSCYPWTCLVCCEGYSGGKRSLPDRARGFIEHLQGENADVPPVTETPPEYVRDILRTQHEAFPQFERYRERLKGLEGVVVVREKPEQDLA